jgi:hypothetical protein
MSDEKVLSGRNFQGQIQAVYTDKSHRILQNISEKSDLEAWDKAGRPHEWECVEIVEHSDRKKYRVWVDYAYGKIALTVDGKLVQYGKDFLSHEGSVIVLEKEFYGVKKYLWF